jgi:hypothetical protein
LIKLLACVTSEAGSAGRQHALQLVGPVIEEGDVPGFCLNLGFGVAEVVDGDVADEEYRGFEAGDESVGESGRDVGTL